MSDYGSGKKYNLDYDTFFSIIDNLYDEIWVYDNNYTIIYVNKACRRHYGANPIDIVGKNFFDLVEDKWWHPSILPHVYADKKTYAIRQVTNLGCELINIATPIFNDKNEILYVAMSVRGPINESDLFHSKYITDKVDKITPPEELLYYSEEMKKVMKLVNRISKIDSTCLITGETGTGKTLLAKQIHRMSDRKEKPFINVNCSSIPNELMESELFGYKKGAFTGARADGRKGLIEAAHEGTLLLDEISELPYNVQAKLLHVIQEKEFTPIGSTAPVKVDIKIIAATNRDLKKLSDAGAFRDDLFYRINVFEIYVPPLRKREGDVEKLIFYFLNLYGEKHKRQKEISPLTLNILLNYSWRGNVRELSHMMERLVVTVDDLVIQKHHLPSSIFAYTFENISYNDGLLEMPFEDTMQALEKKIINEAYKKYASSRKIAKHLSISQTKANNLIKKHVYKP